MEREVLSPESVGQWVSSILSPRPENYDDANTTPSSQRSNNMEITPIRGSRSFDFDGQASTGKSALKSPGFQSPSAGPNSSPSSDASLLRKLRLVERELNTAKQTIQRRSFDMEKVKQDFQNELNEERNKVLRLERDRRLLLQSETDLQHRVQELESSTSIHQESCQKEMGQLQAREYLAKEQLVQIQQQYERMQREHMFVESALETKLHASVQQIETLHQENSRLLEHAKQPNVSSDRLFSISSSPSQSQRDLHKELELVRKTNSEEHTRRELLEKEVISLRESQNQLVSLMNAHRLVNEEKHMLTVQLQNMNEVAHKCTALENELLSLRREKQEWSTFLEGDEVSSPYAVASSLARLRQEQLVAIEKQNSLYLQVSELTDEKRGLQQAISSLKDNVTQLQEKTMQDCRSLKRLETMNSLSTKEISMLKEQIATYDKEAGTQQGQQLANSIQELRDQYNTLWQSVSEDMKSQINEIDRLLKENAMLAMTQQQQQSTTQSEKGNLADQEKLVQLEKDFDGLRIEKEMLKKEIESLLNQLALYEERLGRGEYNAEQTKVLQLRMNPEKIVYKENMDLLSRLKKENKALLDQLSGSADLINNNSSGLSFLPTTSLLQRERIELERRIQESDLRQQRLREVCARKIADFREACYLLTGYRIDMHENDIFRLTPQFIVDENRDFLLFRLDSSKPSGGNMAETDFSKSLPNDIRTLLDDRQCIPAFLAKITLMLFDKKSIGIK